MHRPLSVWAFRHTTGGMKDFTESQEPDRQLYFRRQLVLGATFDTDLIGEIADTIATEARAKYNAVSKKGDRDIYKGLTLWSPNVNIFRDPRWGTRT